MGPIQMLKKMINEHGSSAPLKEQFELLSAQISRLESKMQDLESENTELKKRLDEHKDRVEPLAGELHHSGHCNHCGSALLKKTGNSDSPTFDEAGVKDAAYQCSACGERVAF